MLSTQGLGVCVILHQTLDLQTQTLAPYGYRMKDDDLFCACDDRRALIASALMYPDCSSPCTETGSDEPMPCHAEPLPTNTNFCTTIGLASGQTTNFTCCLRSITSGRFITWWLTQTIMDLAYSQSTNITCSRRSIQSGHPTCLCQTSSHIQTNAPTYSVRSSPWLETGIDDLMPGHTNPPSPMPYSDLHFEHGLTNGQTKNLTIDFTHRWSHPSCLCPTWLLTQTRRSLDIDLDLNHDLEDSLDLTVNLSVLTLLYSCWIDLASSQSMNINQDKNSARNSDLTVKLAVKPDVKLAVKPDVKFADST